MTRLTYLAAVLLFLAHPASAQSTDGAPGGAYRHPVGDTMRYIEFVRARKMTLLPQGELPSSLNRNALIVTTADSAGHWRAWYGDLEVRSIRIGGVVSPDTEFLMGRPFRLGVSDSGDVELFEAPTILRAFTELFDPTTQFVDFFVRVPSSSPARGATWTDTVVSSDLSATTDLRTVRHMRVRGDTLLDGAPATVIEVSTETSVTSRQAVPGWNAPASATLTGADTGIVIFDFADGVMLYRSREGELAGSLTTPGADATETVRYSSTISLSR